MTGNKNNKGHNEVQDDGTYITLGNVRFQIIQWILCYITV